MPGFTLGISNVENPRGLKPIPHDVVYSYTWHFEQLHEGWRPDLNDAIYLKSCNLPEFVVNSEEYKAASISYKYAKDITWPDVKLSFYDTKQLLPELIRMKNSIWTPKDGLKTAVNYKRTSIINVYTANDNDGAAGDAIAGQWRLFGSYLKGLSYSELTYTNSEVHSVNITLSYDWAEFFVPGRNGGGQSEIDIGTIGLPLSEDSSGIDKYWTSRGPRILGGG